MFNKVKNMVAKVVNVLHLVPVEGMCSYRCGMYGMYRVAKVEDVLTGWL